MAQFGLFNDKSSSVKVGAAPKQIDIMKLLECSSKVKIRLIFNPLGN